MDITKDQLILSARAKMSDDQMAAYFGITTGQLASLVGSYSQDDKDFPIMLKTARHYSTAVAKEKSLALLEEGDASQIRFHLQSTEPEYSQKHQIQMEVSSPHELTDEEKQRLAKFLPIDNNEANG